jgi:hypothetical protein
LLVFAVRRQTARLAGSLVCAADERGMSKTSMPCLIVDLEHTSAPPLSENHAPDAPDEGESL